MEPPTAQGGDLLLHPLSRLLSLSPSFQLPTQCPGNTSHISHFHWSLISLVCASVSPNVKWGGGRASASSVFKMKIHVKHLAQWLTHNRRGIKISYCNEKGINKEQKDPICIRCIYRWFLISWLNFFFIFLLYNIVLVLPYIDTNPPCVYMCSPS